MTKKNGLFLLIAVAAIFAGLNFDSNKASINKDSQPTAAITTNDYTVSSFSLVQYDSNGQPLHAISAESAAIDKQQTQLTHPKLLTQTLDGTWQISANTASSDNNFRSLDLQKNVLIEKKMSQASTFEQGFLVQTEALSYSANNKQVTSEVDVSYQDGLMTLTGTGLSANLDTETFDLLTNVRGVRRAK